MEELTETAANQRIRRVRSAGWLSLADLALHCGFSDPKMKELTLLPDFPTPSEPDGWKTARWEKAAVDDWLRAHKREAA